MSTIESIVRSINRDLVPAFEERLRAELANRDREWLVDQIVRLTLDAHSLQEIDRRSVVEAKARARSARRERVKELALDLAGLQDFLAEQSAVTREHLIATGHLAADAPPKGTSMVAAADRSPDGDAVLTRAKDMLFALLFGDEELGTTLERTQQELLTMALPRFKASVLDFMQASNEMSAAGTWQDPDSVSNDDRAENVIIEVQFGEVAGEFVGKGIVTALSVINNLEVNEQVLFARMTNIEETSMII